MSEERIGLSLDRMREAAFDAHRFLQGVEKDTFMQDVILQRAVGMSLLMASELALQLMARYPEFVEQHSEFPWSSMRGMRNRIAHGYFDIDLEKVWSTARDDAVDLVEKIDAIRNWRAQGE
jgi:uncharacterized protein with HEPN domain